MRLMATSALLTTLALIAGPTYAEKSFKDFPRLAGLERTTLSNAEGDRLDLIGYTSHERLPALVVIPGSLCAPLFAALDKDPPGEASATVPLLSEQNRKALNSHVIYLERRNIISLETMSSAPEFTIEQIFKMSPCTERNGGITLEQRVEDVRVQISWLKKQDWVESIHLVGVSEGGDVASGVAAAGGSAVDSLMLIGSAGPTQFSDFVTFARKQNDLKGVKDAFLELDQFLSSSPPASYKGYSSKRWQSFAIDNSPLDLLLKSTVPIFIAHGDQDENVPVASADLAAIELMVKQPQRAIYYWSVTGGDHMLKTSNGRRIGEAIVDYLSWATSRPSGRKFRAD